MEDIKEIKLSSKVFIVLFGGFNIYSIFLMLRIQQSIPKQKELVDNLLSGAPLPAITEFYISNYIYFWILPILTIALFVLAATKKHTSNILYSACVVATFSTIFILQNLTYEATLAPMVEIIESL